jgi:hypothetical protein
LSLNAGVIAVTSLSSAAMEDLFQTDAVIPKNLVCLTRKILKWERLINAGTRYS